MKRLLNAEDVAELLQISKSHAYGLMSSGVMTTVHMGRSVRVTEEDLQAYIDRSRQEAEVPWYERAVSA